MENTRSGDSEFLQSSLWEEFQKSEGARTQRISGEIYSGFFIEHQLPVVGKYMYCPRGPVAKRTEGSERQRELSELVRLGKERNARWLRIEPRSKDDLELIRKDIKNDLGAGRLVVAQHDMQPRQTFCMDISKNEEILLEEMKSKTRYNIRLAKKRGVEILTTHEEKYLDIFYGLVQNTSKRAGITPHPLGHYAHMLKTMPKENAALYIAKYNDEIIAANLVIFYKDTAIYLHGGSSDKDRNVMAPFLLQWQTILDAKEKGCSWYDLGGVKIQGSGGDSSNVISGHWEGITRFKIGFSPHTQPLEYPGTYDIILSPVRYYLYKIISKARSFF